MAKRRTRRTESATDTDRANLTTKYTRLSAVDIRTILELSESGYKQVDIAQIVGCAQATVSTTLKAFSADAKVITTRLKALTDESIEDWRQAREVAAKRGDHRPARELLEAAYPDLRPQQASTNQGGVTVIVAVPNSQDNPRPSVTMASPITASSITMARTEHTLSQGGGQE